MNEQLFAFESSQIGALGIPVPGQRRRSAVQISPRGKPSLSRQDAKSLMPRRILPQDQIRRMAARGLVSAFDGDGDDNLTNLLTGEDNIPIASVAGIITPEKNRGGRPRSPEVAKRNAAILQQFDDLRSQKVPVQDIVRQIATTYDLKPQFVAKLLTKLRAGRTGAGVRATTRASAANILQEYNDMRRAGVPSALATIDIGKRYNLAPSSVLTTVQRERRRQGVPRLRSRPQKRVTPRPSPTQRSAISPFIRNRFEETKTFSDASGNIKAAAGAVRKASRASRAARSAAAFKKRVDGDGDGFTTNPFTGQDDMPVSLAAEIDQFAGQMPEFQRMFAERLGQPDSAMSVNEILDGLANETGMSRELVTALSAGFVREMGQAEPTGKPTALSDHGARSLREMSMPSLRDAARPTAPSRQSVVRPVEPAERSAVRSVAAQLHDQWREARRRPDGTYEPRMKDDGKGGEIDIANTDFENLPPRWQDENLKAAEAAVKFERLNPDVSIDEAAEQVHNDWRERNGSWAPQEQMVDYADLPEDEKEKDRVIARLAREAVAQEGGPRRRRGERPSPSVRGAARSTVPDKQSVAVRSARASQRSSRRASKVTRPTSPAPTKSSVTPVERTRSRVEEIADALGANGGQLGPLTDEAFAANYPQGFKPVRYEGMTRAQLRESRNRNLRSAISKWRIGIEAEQKAKTGDAERLAFDLHPDVKEFIRSRTDDEIIAELERIAGEFHEGVQQQVFVRMPASRLLDFLRDRRYKSTHEVASRHSAASIRDEYERSIGYAPDASAASRPTSGYLSHADWGSEGEFSDLADTARSGLGTDLGVYGGVRLTLKDAAVQRSSYVAGDSLNGGFVPVPLGEASGDSVLDSLLSSTSGGFNMKFALRLLESDRSGSFARMNITDGHADPDSELAQRPNVQSSQYFETLTPGGFDLDEVDEIAISGIEMQELISQRDAAQVLRQTFPRETLQQMGLSEEEIANFYGDLDGGSIIAPDLIQDLMALRKIREITDDLGSNGPRIVWRNGSSSDPLDPASYDDYDPDIDGSGFDALESIYLRRLGERLSDRIAWRRQRDARVATFETENPPRRSARANAGV